jgi:endogenous inhibitor of DNA gyrase (YacG/DUF329 family)
MKIDIEADVVRVLEPQTFASGSSKVEVHLTWMEQNKDGVTFEQVVPVECWGSRVDTALTFNKGDKVKAQCYLGGREWRKDENSKWRAFMSLRCARIELVEAGDSKPPAKQASLKDQVLAKAATQNTEADDLPF